MTPDTDAPPPPGPGPASRSAEELLRLSDIHARLRMACEQEGDQSHRCTRRGVSEQFVSSVQHGVRSPSPRVLVALGLRRAVCYVADESAEW